MAVRRYRPRTRPGPARRGLAPRGPDVITERELARGTPIECILRGNRVRRFKQFDPLPVPARRCACRDATSACGCGTTPRLKRRCATPPRPRPGAPAGGSGKGRLDDVGPLHRRGATCTPSGGSPSSWSAASRSTRYRWESGTGARARSPLPRRLRRPSPRPSSASTADAPRPVVTGWSACTSTRVHRHHMDVALIGTAVRPVGSRGSPERSSPPTSGAATSPFSRLGLGAGGPGRGASFVYAPRRWAGVAMQAEVAERRADQLHRGHVRGREAAMERMQQSALAWGGPVWWR